MDDQLQIDFSRAEQLSLLRRVLPSVVIHEGSRPIRVEAAHLKLVLRTLDDYCRGAQGYPSQATIVADAGLGSERKFRRILTALRQLNLVATRAIPIGPGRETRLMYRIVWPELAQYPEVRRGAEEARVDRGGAEEAHPGSAGHGRDRPATAGIDRPPAQYRPATAVAGETSETLETDPGPGAGTDKRISLSELAAAEPLLRSAVGRVVPALPCEGSWRQSVYRGIAEGHLRDLRRVVRWWRSQLTAARPVTGSTFAELLLVCAAARRAATLPADQVQSRKGLFVRIVSRGAWLRVLYLITDAFEREVATALAEVSEIGEIGQGQRSTADREAAEAAARLRRERDEIERLEAEYGPAFDLLDRDEQIAIARAALTDFALDCWKRSRGKTMRTEVLTHFAARVLTGSHHRPSRKSACPSGDAYHPQSTSSDPK